MNPTSLLYLLLRISIGTENMSDSVCAAAEGADWQAVLKLASAQGVTGMAVEGLQQLCDFSGGRLGLNTIEKPVRREWIRTLMQIEALNEKTDSQAAELTRIFADAGMRSCVLKGQGAALLYPNPSRRKSGDIDLWVEGGRMKVLRFLKKTYKIGLPTYHHVDADILPGASVEIHYLPAWLYNPVANRRLQAFFDAEASAQFDNFTEKGFAHPTVRFNLVFMAIHIYKHVYEENVQLKQLLDYYYVLWHSTVQQRAEAHAFLESLGLRRFEAYLMYLMSSILALPEELMLCAPSNCRRRPFFEAICFNPWRVWQYVWRRIIVLKL